MLDPHAKLSDTVDRAKLGAKSSVDAKIPIGRYIKSADTLFEGARRCRDNGATEHAFFLYTKFAMYV